MSQLCTIYLLLTHADTSVKFTEISVPCIDSKRWALKCVKTSVLWFLLPTRAIKLIPTPLFYKLLFDWFWYWNRSIDSSRIVTTTDIQPISVHRCKVRKKVNVLDVDSFVTFTNLISVYIMLSDLVVPWRALCSVYCGASTGNWKVPQWKFSFLFFAFRSWAFLTLNWNTY